MQDTCHNFRRHKTDWHSVLGTDVQYSGLQLYQACISACRYWYSIKQRKKSWQYREQLKKSFEMNYENGTDMYQSTSVLV